MKKKTLLLIAAIFMVLSGFSQIDPPDQFIQSKMNTLHIPGVQACIIVHDSIAWHNNYGWAIMEENDSVPVSDSTLFNAFSIGKTFTTVNVLQLWENGLIGLDEDINSFLTFQIDNPHIENDTITPRMLMTHTSCIRDYNFPGNYVMVGDPTESLGSFLENYLTEDGDYYSINNFYNAVPGWSYFYSNIGTALDGYLVFEKTNMLFKNYIHDSLFVPLEMYNTAYFLSEIPMENLATGYDYSGGYNAWDHYGIAAYPGISMRSSAEQISHMVIAFLNNGLYNGKQIINTSTIDSMCMVHQNSNSMQLGMGLYKKQLAPPYSQTIWGHDGGGDFGYAAHMYFCPDENTGVVIMTNSSTFIWSTVNELFQYAAMIVIAEDATEINETYFVANWKSAAHASGYYLDVARDDDFTDFVEGFENLDVDNITFYLVDGLENGHQYYYRIRPYNDEVTGNNSGTISVSTLYTSIADNTEELNIDILPIPGGIKVISDINTHTPSYIQIFDMSGRLIINQELQSNTGYIPLRSNKQLFLLKLINGKKSFTGKILL